MYVYIYIYIIWNRQIGMCAHRYLSSGLRIPEHHLLHTKLVLPGGKLQRGGRSSDQWFLLVQRQSARAGDAEAFPQTNRHFRDEGERKKKKNRTTNGIRPSTIWLPRKNNGGQPREPDLTGRELKGRPLEQLPLPGISFSAAQGRHLPR